MSWNLGPKRLPDKKKLFKKRKKRNQTSEKEVSDDAKIYYPSDFARDIAWNYGASDD